MFVVSMSFPRTGLIMFSLFVKYIILSVIYLETQVTSDLKDNRSKTQRSRKGGFWPSPRARAFLSMVYIPFHFRSAIASTKRSPLCQTPHFFYRERTSYTMIVRLRKEEDRLRLVARLILRSENFDRARWPVSLDSRNTGRARRWVFKKLASFGPGVRSTFRRRSLFLALAFYARIFLLLSYARGFLPLSFSLFFSWFVSWALGMFFAKMTHYLFLFYVR